MKFTREGASCVRMCVREWILGNSMEIVIARVRDGAVRLLIGLDVIGFEQTF